MEEDDAGSSALDESSVVQWLTACAEVGDLVLTGSGDVASRAIQTGSRSRVSHAAIVTADNTVTEAYDYSLTLGEHDEGMYTTSFADFLGRTKKLRTIIVLRPEGVDVAKLQSAARDLHRDSRPYPTFGAILLSICRIFSETVPLPEEGLFGQHRMGKRFHHRLDRFATRQVRFIGDGTSKIQCAESVLMLYEKAGLRVDLDQPLLARSIERAKPFGHNSNPGRPTTTKDRVGPPRPTEHGAAGRAGRWAGRLRRIVGMVKGVRLVLHRRSKAMDLAHPGDYVFPADLVDNSSFKKIGEYTEQRVRRQPRMRRRRRSHLTDGRSQQK